MSLKVSLVLGLGALAAIACNSGRSEVPPTGVDLTTPVEELPEWNALLSDLTLPYNRDQALANFVETFRGGLDISRRIADPDERLAAEIEWWSEAERSLEAIVGPDVHGYRLGSRPRVMRGA